MSVSDQSTAQRRSPISLEAYFRRDPESARLRDVAIETVRAAGPSTMRRTRSQIAFRRGNTFAWIWAPRQYLGAKAAPLVVSIALRRQIRSRRWKEVVSPRPGMFVHHLEVWRARDLDHIVRKWIADAWAAALAARGGAA